MKPLLSLILVVATFFYFPPFAQSDTPSPRIVMLGDSITAWGNWTSLLSRRDVWNQGVAGDRTGDVLARMEKVVLVRPKYCFVMIGINDILSGQPVDRIFDNYRKIIDGLIKGKIIPIIQSTLYLAGPDPQNKSVDALNTKIEQLAVERKILYLDLNRRLAPNKQLLPAFTNDGLHLNKAGYQAWKAELTKFFADSHSPRGQIFIIVQHWVQLHQYRFILPLKLFRFPFILVSNGATLKGM